MTAVTIQQTQPSLNTPSFFSSAFLEMNVFDQCFSAASQPESNPATSLDAFSPKPPNQQPPTPPALARSGLAPNFSPYLQASPTTPPYFQYDSAPLTQGIHPLQTNMWLLPNYSPPQSANSPAEKFDFDGGRAQSPLDNMLVGFNTETRSVHGQVTPPEDVLSGRSLSLNRYDMVDNNDQGKYSAQPVQPEQPERPSSTRARRGASKSESTESSGVRKQKKHVRQGEGGDDVQEAKRKKFLERNRVAASKCRQKKKMWMQELEENARNAQQESRILHSQVACLKDELLVLKGELLKHDGCDCEQIKRYLLNQATLVAEGATNTLMEKQRQNSSSPTERSLASFDNESERSEEPVDSRRMSLSVYGSMRGTPQFSPV